MDNRKTYFAIIYSKDEHGCKKEETVVIPNSELWDRIQSFKDDEESVAIFEADCILDWS